MKLLVSSFIATSVLSASWSNYEPYWKTYLDNGVATSEWSHSVEYAEGVFIKGIGQGISRKDKVDSLGTLFGALTTDKYQRNLVQNVIIDGADNEILFTLNCDNDAFI